MPEQSNTNDPATLAAAEALAALGVGDTALARQKYAEAGGILEREMKARHGGGEKQLLRFLAATQYYKGGDYQKAQELAQKIDAGALPKNVRGLLPQFLKDVKLRAAPGYAIGIRRTLHSLWLEQKPREAIAILQEHPFVVDAIVLALLRAELCDQLPDYRAAALFFVAALRRAAGAAQLAFISAATPLNLLSQDRLAEAAECVRYRLELLSHPVTFVTAALVRYHQFIKASGGERQRRLDELLAFVEQAWDAYQKLPAGQQNHPDMRAYMAFGFEIAAVSWLLQGNKERSVEARERAGNLGANSVIPQTWAASPEPVVRAAVDGQHRYFAARFAPEPSIRQQLEVVGA